jgi:putative glutamine amidotransferase
MDAPDGPRVVVTVAVPALGPEPDLAAHKNQLYADAVARHGADAILLDAAAGQSERDAALATMSGLLLSGGADLDPGRYGREPAGAVAPEPERDALEAAAFAAAMARGVPVLGLCRGLQAINVFLGGTLLQHVEGHVGASYGHGRAATHPIRLEPASRLAAWLGSVERLEVNSYHHQAIRPLDLAPGLVASAWAASADGDLVEGVEAPGERFVVGVQCHPERTESTPDAFEGLFAAFVAACRAWPTGARPR